MDRREMDEVKRNIVGLKEGEARPFSFAQIDGGAQLYVGPHEGEPATLAGTRGCAGQVSRIDGMLIFALTLERGAGKAELQQGLDALAQTLPLGNWKVSAADQDKPEEPAPFAGPG